MWVVYLSSNYHNDQRCWLGMKHKTKADAIEYVKNNICLRCNIAEYYQIDDKWEYQNREKGFVPQRI